MFIVFQPFPFLTSFYFIATTYGNPNPNLLPQHNPEVDLDGSDGLKLVQNFTIEVGLSDIQFKNTLLLAIVQEAIAKLQVADLVNHDLGCLLKEIYVVNASVLQFNFKGVETLRVSGWGDFDPIFNALMSDVYQLFQLSIPRLVNGIATGPVIDMLNTVTTGTLINATCAPIMPPTPPGKMPGMIDWQTDETYGALQNLINHTVGPSGVPGAAVIIELLTKGNAAFSLNLDVSKTFDIPSLGKVTVGVTQINASSLDTISGITLFNPTAPQELNSLRLTHRT